MFFPFCTKLSFGIFCTLVVLHAVHVNVFCPSLISVGSIVIIPSSQSWYFKQLNFILYLFAYALAYELQFAQITAFLLPVYSPIYPFIILTLSGIIIFFRLTQLLNICKSISSKPYLKLTSVKL